MVAFASAAPVISSVIGGASGIFSANSSNKAAKKAAKVAYDRQKQMMQSAHQWEVGDLKAAGLNPVLSAGGSPSGYSAQQAATFNQADAVAKGAKGGLEALLAKEQVQNISADTSLKQASAKAQNAQAALTNTTNIQQSRFSPVYGAIGDVTKSAVDWGRDKADAVKSSAKSAWDYINPKNLYREPMKAFKKWKGN